MGRERKRERVWGGVNVLGYSREDVGRMMMMVSRRQQGKEGAEGEGEEREKAESSPTSVMNKSQLRSPRCLARRGPAGLHGYSSSQMSWLTLRERAKSCLYQLGTLDDCFACHQLPNSTSEVKHLQSVAGKTNLTMWTPPWI
ncbi:unnamed protein product [Pleuronectes platessa]|uniref:Uncharacterized protein n=1 Tax=Pleuronectes platessa TaxID=8262 RepID=A0A9N7UD66_PLEPL|nr:unnamed protein product [Pleuronectes platessa]